MEAQTRSWRDCEARLKELEQAGNLVKAKRVMLEERRQDQLKKSMMKGSHANDTRVQGESKQLQDRNKQLLDDIDLASRRATVMGEATRKILKLEKAARARNESRRTSEPARSRRHHGNTSAHVPMLFGLSSAMPELSYGHTEERNPFVLATSTPYHRPAHRVSPALQDTSQITDCSVSSLSDGNLQSSTVVSVSEGTSTIITSDASLSGDHASDTEDTLVTSLAKARELIAALTVPLSTKGMAQSMSSSAAHGTLSALESDSKRVNNLGFLVRVPSVAARLPSRSNEPDWPQLSGSGPGHGGHYSSLLPPPSAQPPTAVPPSPHPSMTVAPILPPFLPTSAILLSRPTTSLRSGHLLKSAGSEYQASVLESLPGEASAHDPDQGASKESAFAGEGSFLTLRQPNAADDSTLSTGTESFGFASSELSDDPQLQSSQRSVSYGELRRLSVSDDSGDESTEVEIPKRNAVSLAPIRVKSAVRQHPVTTNPGYSHKSGTADDTTTVQALVEQLRALQLQLVQQQNEIVQLRLQQSRPPTATSSFALPVSQSSVVPVQQPVSGEVPRHGIRSTQLPGHGPLSGVRNGTGMAIHGLATGGHPDWNPAPRNVLPPSQRASSPVRQCSASEQLPAASQEICPPSRPHNSADLHVHEQHGSDWKETTSHKNMERHSLPEISPLAVHDISHPAHRAEGVGFQLLEDPLLQAPVSDILTVHHSDMAAPGTSLPSITHTQQTSPSLVVGDGGSLAQASCESVTTAVVAATTVLSDLESDLPSDHHGDVSADSPLRLSGSLGFSVDTEPGAAASVPDEQDPSQPEPPASPVLKKDVLESLQSGSVSTIEFGSGSQLSSLGKDLIEIASNPSTVESQAESPPNTNVNGGDRRRPEAVTTHTTLSSGRTTAEAPARIAGSPSTLPQLVSSNDTPVHGGSGAEWKKQLAALLHMMEAMMCNDNLAVIETDNLFQSALCSEMMSQRIANAAVAGADLGLFSPNALSVAIVKQLRTVVELSSSLAQTSSTANDTATHGGLIADVLLRKHSPPCTSEAEFRAHLAEKWWPCWDALLKLWGKLLALVDMDTIVNAFSPVLVSHHIHHPKKLEKATLLLQAVIMDEFAAVLVGSDENVSLSESSVSLPLSPTDPGSLADTLPTSNPLALFAVDQGKKHQLSAHTYVSEEARDAKSSPSLGSEADPSPDESVAAVHPSISKSSSKDSDLTLLGSAEPKVPANASAAAARQPGHFAAGDSDEVSACDSESDEPAAAHPALANFYNRFLASSRPSATDLHAASDESDADDMLNSIAGRSARPSRQTGRQQQQQQQQQQTKPVSHNSALSESMIMYGVKETDSDSDSDSS